MGKTKDQCLKLISENFLNIDRIEKISDKVALLEKIICELTGGEKASVVAYNNETNRLKSLDFQKEYELEESVLKDVIESKKVFFNNHILIHKNYNKSIDNPKNIKLKSVLILPVLYKQKVIGCLCNYNSFDHAYDFQRYDTRCISLLEKQSYDILFSLLNKNKKESIKNKKIEKKIVQEIVFPIKKEKNLNIKSKRNSQISELELQLKQKDKEIQELNKALELKEIIDVELEDEKELSVEQNELKIIIDFLTNEVNYFSNDCYSLCLLLEMVKNSLHDEAQLKYIESQLNSVNLVESLADKLYEKNKIFSERKNFRSFEKFASLANLYENSLYHDHIQFNVFLDPKIPLTLNGDIQIIESILIHLLNNAKTLISEFGTIELLMIFSQENNQLECRIQGRNKKEKKSFFKLFKKQKKNNFLTTNKTGIGLSISSNLLKIIGGKLQLTTEEDDVHSFNISIPVETTSINQKEVIFKAKKPMKIAILLDDKDTEAYVNIRRYLEIFGIKDANILAFKNHKKMNGYKFSHLFCFSSLLSAKVDLSSFHSVTILYYSENEMYASEYNHNKIYLNAYYGMTLQEILFPGTSVEIKGKNILMKKEHLFEA